jgi:hypothetical protein
MEPTKPLSWRAVPLVAAGAVAYPVCALLLRLGLLQTVDPWRHSLGLGLRSEGSKFGLSAFSLRVPPGADTDQGLLEALGDFLETEPEVPWVVRSGQHCDWRERAARTDLVAARFDGDALAGLTVRPDRRHPWPGPVEVGPTIDAYNRARHLPEVGRGGYILQMVSGEKYMQRMLESTLMVVESADSTARFIPPDFRRFRSLGFNTLTFVIRRIPAGLLDIWVQVHHVGADGAPTQELLSRLATRWGREETAFPPEETALAHCSIKGERDLWTSSSFLDFAPFLARRAAAVWAGAPVAAQLLWELAALPAFTGRRFAVAVDVPPQGSWSRAVDLISLRPADFALPADYIARFRELVQAARARSSPTWRTMERAATLPAALAASALAHIPEGSRRNFGTVGLSILKDAEVFTAPMSDHAFEEGFLAIGRLGLPSAGGTVGCLSVKGTRAQAESYPELFRRLLARG